MAIPATCQESTSYATKVYKAIKRPLDLVRQLKTDVKKLKLKNLK